MDRTVHRASRSRSAGNGASRRSRASCRRGGGYYAAGLVRFARSFFARDAGTCTATRPTWRTAFWSTRIWVRVGQGPPGSSERPHAKPLCPLFSPDPSPCNFLLSPDAEHSPAHPRAAPSQSRSQSAPLRQAGPPSMRRSHPSSIAHQCRAHRHSEFHSSHCAPGGSRPLASPSASCPPDSSPLSQSHIHLLGISGPAVQKHRLKKITSAFSHPSEKPVPSPQIIQ